MSKHDTPDTASAIRQAIKAKRERRTTLNADLAEFESSLLADIERFDLDLAKRQGQTDKALPRGTGLLDSGLSFPALGEAATQPVKPAVRNKPVEQAAASPAPAASKPGSLLDQLRHEAEQRKRQLVTAEAEKTSSNAAIDQALKYLFFYLHDFVQQLNVVQPAIPRTYTLAETLTLEALNWQEGFSDYRQQSAADGALTELVTLSYSLHSPGLLRIEREGAGIERFRTQLFDAGLQFTSKEFRNERRYVERAEFEIQTQLSVNARWRADFEHACLILETRNLERLGSARFVLGAHCIDDALLDEFGRLVLGQTNRFRELIRR